MSPDEGMVRRGWRWILWAVASVTLLLPVSMSLLEKGLAGLRVDDVVHSGYLAGLMFLGYLVVHRFGVPRMGFLITTQLVLLFLSSMVMDGGVIFYGSLFLWGVLDLLLALAAFSEGKLPAVSSIKLGAAGSIWLAAGIFVHVSNGGVPGWHTRDRAEMVSCMNDLKQVGTALMLYQTDSGCYPSDTGVAYLLRLRTSGYLTNPKSFGCNPARKQAAFLDPKSGLTIGYEPNPALAGQGPEAYRVPDPSSVPWVWDRQPFHDKGRVRCVLFLDGSARAMKEPGFQAMLAKGSR